MKNIILISILLYSCCPCKQVLKTSSTEDFMRPTIDTLKGGYYLTRCACFLGDNAIVYPTTLKEAHQYEDSLGFKCNKFSIPLEWIK